jgi:hypothetical protein
MLVTDALARAAKSEDLRTRCEVELAWARVSARSGGLAPSAKAASDAAARSGAAGFLPLELEAKLLEGELAREAGQQQLGDQLATAVFTRAQQAGLGLLAKKAGA